VNEIRLNTISGFFAWQKNKDYCNYTTQIFALKIVPFIYINVEEISNLMK
jgi:hypothetical protein